MHALVTAVIFTWVAYKFQIGKLSTAVEIDLIVFFRTVAEDYLLVNLLFWASFVFFCVLVEKSIEAMVCYDSFAIIDDKVLEIILLSPNFWPFLIILSVFF